MNLVSNAIKYMPRDAALRVVRIRAVVDQVHARVEVADTGAGVPEAVHERIFEPYVRVDQSQPGLGLRAGDGARHLVDAHRGQVGVRSIDGDGALFWFALPLRPSGAREDERAS